MSNAEPDRIEEPWIDDGRATPIAGWRYDLRSWIAETGIGRHVPRQSGICVRGRVIAPWTLPWDRYEVVVS